MNPGLEVEGHAFLEGSSGEDNRIGLMCTNNLRRLSCSALKEINCSGFLISISLGVKCLCGK